MACGQTNRGIAIDLGISVKTLDIHRSKIVRKMGCETSGQAVVACVRAILFQAALQDAAEGLWGPNATNE